MQEKAGIEYWVGECALGELLVGRTERGVCAVFLGDHAGALVEELRANFPEVELVERPVDGAFRAVIQAVEGRDRGELELDLGGTEFQRRVWQALREIPLGETRSYRELAMMIDAPKSARAVAGACAANKIAVLIPCHRALRADGKLSGFRWGIERKKMLLRREGALK